MPTGTIQWKHPKAKLAPPGLTRALSHPFPRIDPPGERDADLFLPDGTLRPDAQSRLQAFGRFIGLDDIWIAQQQHPVENAPPERPLGVFIYLVADATRLVRLFQLSGHAWRLAGATLEGVPKLAYGPEAYPQAASGPWVNLRRTRDPELVAWTHYNEYLLPSLIEGLNASGLHDRYDFEMRPLPRPGVPTSAAYRRGRYPIPFWSVNERAWFISLKTPTDWNPCTLPKRFAYGQPDGPVVFQSRLPGASPLTLVHVGDPEPDRLLYCQNGLFSPSIAVSWRQLMWTGRVAFYFDARLLAETVKPSARRLPTVHLFEGDGWTTRAAQWQEYRTQALDELSGVGTHAPEGNWLSVLGPSVEELIADEGGAFGMLDGMKRIRTETGLVKRMRALRQLHVSYDPVPDELHKVPWDRYPYSELKVMDRIGLDEIPLAVIAPDGIVQRDKYIRMLGGHGFRGTVLTLPYGRKDFDTPERAEAATNLVLRWATDNRKVYTP